jgi:hypothetical protein
MDWCGYNGGVLFSAFCYVHLHLASSYIQHWQVKFLKPIKLFYFYFLLGHQKYELATIVEFMGCSNMDLSFFVNICGFLALWRIYGNRDLVKFGCGFCRSSVKEEFAPLKLKEFAIQKVNVLEALLEDFKKAYFLTSAHSSL